MTDTSKDGADLLTLAETAKRHLRERGHEVSFATNGQMTAFDINKSVEDGDDLRLCRVQSIHGNTWEMVRPNGETLTGMGDETTFLAMLERVVEPPKQRYGR